MKNYNVENKTEEDDIVTTCNANSYQKTPK